MNMKPSIFWLAATVAAIGLLATGCPTDAGNGADPELRGIVTIDFAAPLGVGTVVTAGVMNLTAGGDIYFQWQRGAAPDFADIDEPTVDGNTHKVTTADMGHQIRVVVTRAGTTGQIESTLVPVPVVPSLEGIVKIDHDGALTVDTLLTATAADLTAGGAIYFRWQRGTYPNFTDIGGPVVNGNTHTITDGDIGHQIRVVVTRAGTIGQIESGYVGPVNVPRRLVADQIADLRTGVPPAEITITTGIADERITPQILAFGDRRRVTITLTRGYPGDILYLVGPGAMFTVGNGVTLVLQDIELRGVTNNTNALVVVQNGGTLVMDTGARIAGNINTNQNDANQGGGVRVNNGGTFTMEDGEISGNAGIFGGGVFNMGTFAMEGGKISDNTAETFGGGVDNFGTFIMSDGEIFNNNAWLGGGLVNGNTFIMEGGKISENTAPRGGGVLNNFNSAFTMYDGEISGNIATVLDGGGVVNGGTFIMHDGKILGNTAIVGGGVAVVEQGLFRMYDGEISGNTATEDGGGVANNNGTFTMHRGEISGNTAQVAGGGVFNFGGGAVFNMNSGLIAGNTAEQQGGGGVASWGGASNAFFNMRGGAITGNVTGGSGGGVLNVSALFRISDGVILGANATTGGNTASSGAALMNTFVASGIYAVSQFGLFSNGGFFPSGNLPGTDITIEVVNGDRIMPTSASGSLGHSLPADSGLVLEELARCETTPLPRLPDASEFGRVFERLR